MTSPVGSAPGRVCLIALNLQEASEAGEFYQRMFGWTRDVNEGSDAIELNCEDGMVGTVSPPTRGAPQGIPGWVLLFSVKNVDRAVRKIEAAGGALLTPPFATADAGTVAVVRAPGGEIFCLRWMPESARTTAPGVLPWMEVVTRDPDQAKDFYAGLFGWTFRDRQWKHGTYTSIMAGEERIGGVVQYSPAFGDQAFEAALRGKPTIEKEAIIPHWMVFFGVKDLEAALDRAEEIGIAYRGRVYEIPDKGRFAMIRDDRMVFMSLLELSA